MEKKLFKKMLAILMIIMVVATDFFVLGSNLISYAASGGTTNNENIEFSAYFKDEEGNKINNTLQSIKKSDLKMYVEIKVNKEGYFNGSIELQDSNFKLKNNILSEHISSIEGNKVNLKQINSGSTIEIELDIEPVTEETVRADLMNMETTVKLTGQYMEESDEGVNIEGTDTLTLAYEADETAKPELETEIITNNVMSVNGANKRVVQLSIKSRLSENQFPVTQTTINVDLPELSSKLPEEVKVLALGTEATNGQSARVIEGFKNEDGTLQIIFKNDPNEENKITWNKNVYDELVVTLIYSEDVDASVVEITTNSELMLCGYSEPFTASSMKKIEGMTLNGTITTNIESNSTEIYKGQLYVNTKTENIKDIEYKTKTTLEITTNNLVDGITIHEGEDAFRTADGTELAANTKFVSLKINKDKMLSILGQDGSIYINDGETIHTLTKDTDTDDAGNIIINYLTSQSELTITTTKPEKAGLLEFEHTKAILKDNYTFEQLKTINSLVSKNTVSGVLGETTVVENSTETSILLTETITKAELTVDKDSLSTMTTNNELTLGIKLITDGVQYDLYKNPTIQVQLPKELDAVNVNSINHLYADEFQINAQLDPTNKIIYITLNGEQLDYPETQATQLFIQINLSVTLSKLTPSATDKITLTYTNENATQYDGGRTDMGVVEKQIEIVSPSGLIPVNNIGNYNIEAIGGISEDKQLANIDKNTAGGTDVTYNISLVNNTKNDVNNVRILGVFPTSGEFTFGTETITNNFETTLKSSIVAENATVYYTNNINATEDINDANNGWTQNLAEVVNPKAYLIIIPTLGQAGTFNTTYTVTLPTTLDYGLTSYAGYKVIYNDAGNTSDQKVESLLTGITTGEGVKLETNISAAVGNETINDGDTVKAGEVIRYTVTAKNNGTQTLTNVVLKGGVSEGTVYVEPNRGNVDSAEDAEGMPPEDVDYGYVYSGASYYNEFPDTKEVSRTIENFEPGQEYSFTYEVRVNMDSASIGQTSNKSTVSYQEFNIESSEFKTTISDAKLRVTVKNIVDEEIPVMPGGGTQYAFFVENLSDQPISGLTVQLIPEGISIKQIKDEELNLITVEDINNIKIGEVPANGSILYRVPASINEDASKINISLKVTDTDGNIYRSNIVTREVESEGAIISLTSPNDGEYVSVGDEIIYNFVVENTSSYNRPVTIVDNIPEELYIYEISLNGEIQMQTYDTTADTYAYMISNNLNYNVTFTNTKKSEVQIKTRVKSFDEEFETKILKNSAEAKIGQKTCDTSEEVTHILRGNTQQDLENMISGVTWLDENRNGQRDSGERLLSDIKVILFDVSTNNIATDKDGNTAETTTDADGAYTFTRINDGNYIVLFEFDRTQYELTDYMKEGVPDSLNSKAVLKSIEINGQENTYGVTDTINLTESITNISMGLKENSFFDLELDKYISRISIQNAKGTKSYDYEDSVFEKVEIHRNQLNNSLVVLEYTIRVTNTGELAGNVNSIVDYMDNGLQFSSELNPDWYLSGNMLYTNSLSNERIQPGETREVKLILTKDMTENNTGRVNNRAEIAEYYNELGKIDIDSTPNNLEQNEDDLGVADVIISISTGVRTIGYTILILINIGLIAFAIYLIFKRNRRV